MSATCRRSSAACTTKDEEEEEEGRRDEEKEGRRERERGKMVLASKRKLAFAFEEDEEGRKDEEEEGRPFPGLNSWRTAAKPEMDQLSICSTTLPPLWGS